jgi:hypothetical protein
MGQTGRVAALKTAQVAFYWRKKTTQDRILGGLCRFSRRLYFRRKLSHCADFLYGAKILIEDFRILLSNTAV